MKIRRTANAGVLLEIDGLSVLLDGVCNRVEQYMETPPLIRKELEECFPDIVAFTHAHDDHYDRNYAEKYEAMTLRPVYGSEVFFLEENGVTIQSVSTRHIGKTDVFHMSIIIRGSKTVWFMGDASPLEMKKLESIAAPDVVIAPFAYANTPSAFKSVKNTGAKDLVIVHLPEREFDSYGLWNAVEENTEKESLVHIPKMGEVIEI